MKPQRRYIKLTYVVTGESVLAEMLDDEAPKVCSEVWQMLPLEDVVIHGQYSGAEVFIRLSAPRSLPNENLAQIPLPGEIYYFFDIGSNVTSGGKPGAEICLVYGRGVTFRGPEGSPTTASLFARIPGDWKYDWVDFAIASRRARFEGPHKLRIERVER